MNLTILKRNFATSLASSGESDDGGLVPPPRKKTKVSVDDTTSIAMHQQANGSLNGAANDEYDIASSSKQNGDIEECPSETSTFGKVDEDIVRLIGQHLRLIGMK